MTAPMTLTTRTLLRSRRLYDVAEALYRAHRLDRRAKLSDLAPVERAVYLEQAEAAWTAIQSSLARRAS